MLAAALCVAAAAIAAAPPAQADTPVAAFSTSPPAPDVGHPVTFDASASSDPGGEAITSYQWTFGDGVTQTSPAPVTTHVYAAAGSYTALLTVEDSGGNASPAVTKVVMVAPDVPIARFSVSPASAFVGRSLKFDGAGSSDRDGDAIVSYRWNFGDGATATTSTATTSHAYGSAATFTATLTVIDSHGNTSAPRSRPVSVSTPTGPPVAQFTFSPTRPLPGQAVTFDALHSTASAGTIKSFRWTFGDHTSATTTIPTTKHAFARAGSFAVTLGVTDSRGRHSKAVTHKIVVAASPKPAISKLHVRTCKRKASHCPRRGLYVSFKLSVRDRVVITITRRHHRRTLKRVVINARNGSTTHRIRLAHLGAGRYVLRARPVGGSTARANFRWHLRA